MPAFIMSVVRRVMSPAMAGRYGFWGMEPYPLIPGPPAPDSCAPVLGAPYLAMWSSICWPVKPSEAPICSEVQPLRAIASVICRVALAAF